MRLYCLLVLSACTFCVSRGAEVHSTSVEGLFSGFSLSFFSFFKLANSFLDGLYFVGVFFTCRKTRLVEKQDL